MVFEQAPPWDVESKYTLADIRLYYENLESGILHSVDTRATLKSVLSQKSQVLSFQIIVINIIL